MSEGFYVRHPVDDIEPDAELAWSELGEVRKRAFLEASRCQLFILNQAVDHILRADDHGIATWQVAFSLGLSCCQGLTMTKVAEALLVTPAAISKGAHAFCERIGVPPSLYMKSEEASVSYRQKRIVELRSTSCHMLN